MKTMKHTLTLLTALLFAPPAVLAQPAKRLPASRRSEARLEQ